MTLEPEEQVLSNLRKGKRLSGPHSMASLIDSNAYYGFMRATEAILPQALDKAKTCRVIHPAERTFYFLSALKSIIEVLEQDPHFIR